MSVPQQPPKTLKWGNRPVLERKTGEVVFEFVEGHGDDTQVSLSLVQTDLESQTLAEFQSKWL